MRYLYIPSLFALVPLRDTAQLETTKKNPPKKRKKEATDCIIITERKESKVSARICDVGELILDDPDLRSGPRSGARRIRAIVGQKFKTRPRE